MVPQCTAHEKRQSIDSKVDKTVCRFVGVMLSGEILETSFSEKQADG